MGGEGTENRDGGCSIPRLASVLYQEKMDDTSVHWPIASPPLPTLSITWYGAVTDIWYMVLYTCQWFPPPPL
jgi:hypothetical protein